MTTDLTFLTNEPGRTLLERFQTLLGTDTRFFDCLVGYFFISGFYRLAPSLVETERIRILIGLKTDRTTYNLLQKAKGEQLELSHAETKEQVGGFFLLECDDLDQAISIAARIPSAERGSVELRPIVEH